jgi:hypothetical protein
VDENLFFYFSHAHFQYILSFVTCAGLKLVLKFIFIVSRNIAVCKEIEFVTATVIHIHFT